MLDAAGPDRGILAALLRWYVDMGVDCPVGETAVDRFAESLQKSAPKWPATTPAPVHAESLADPVLRRRRPPEA